MSAFRALRQVTDVNMASTLEISEVELCVHVSHIEYHLILIISLPLSYSRLLEHSTVDVDPYK